MISRLLIEADGGSRGNPGPAGSGVLLVNADTGQLLAEAAVFHGTATNNYAEYKAIIVGIQLANELAPDASIEVKMDSKLVVEQASGRWKVKHDGIADLVAELRSLIGARQVVFEWIPREHNLRADALANQAMDSQRTEVRKFLGEPGTNSIAVVTEPISRGVDVEFNKELPSSVRAPKATGEQLTTIILVRHGRTTLTESHRISGRNGSDPELSESGLADANKVALELSKVGVVGMLASVRKPEMVISSPMLRTRQTSEAIAKELGIPVEIENDLAEIDFGDWDGHTNDEVAENWPQLLESWRGSVKVSPPNGESLEAFDLRLKAVRENLISKYAGKTIVVVAHVMPIRSFVRDVLEAGWESYWRISIAPCSITTVRYWGLVAKEASCVNYSGHL